MAFILALLAGYHAPITLIKFWQLFVTIATYSSIQAKISLRSLYFQNLIFRFVTFQERYKQLIFAGLVIHMITAGFVRHASRLMSP